MAELVASAFLSSFLQVAFQKLASHNFLDYFRRRGMDHSLLRKLHAILLSVDKIVEAAEERQYRHRSVKLWLDELKDEVFKAQDLLDDIATEDLRQKLDAESQTAASGEVLNFFTSPVNQNQFDKEIELGIQRVLNNLEYLIKQHDILGLRGAPSAGIESGVHMSVYKRFPTTRLIDESDMYGRDDDKDTIVGHLLSQSMDVIAITGMGGMGKTTLAKLVYEDVKIKDQFEHRAWVCVSEEFDVHQVTKKALQSLNCPTEQLHDLHSYQLKLKETLMGKKFFLVLDDVWNENCTIWDVFRAPLKHAAPQSRILVTTRNRKVAQVMCSTFTHSLKPLKDGDCWDLFEKHAFNNQHHLADLDHLVKIGRKIVKRCGGLPLAIKTLGSLLHRNPFGQYWDKILKSDLWELPENDSHIIPSLRLSYHYLPSNLKSCFAYCSIFPKDYNIDKNVLIQLWMADGLIYPTQKSMSLEEAGNEMFNDLESRSFFEPSRNGDDYFIMHDLVNDLAKSVTQEFFVQLEVDQAQDISTKTRCFSYINKNYENLKIPVEVFKCHRLRTFLILDLAVISYRSYTCVDIKTRLSELKYIRELSLSRYKNDSKNWTDCISNMKHLHYLDLSNTEVEKLPDSMCFLINLQTLKLRGCGRLTELPSNFYKLINLRHLDLEGCRIQEMPQYMGKLNQLRTMNKFVVAEKGGSNIKELGALKHLTGSLAISNMEGIKDAADMREANLKAKQLHTLKLLYGQSKYNHNEAQHQEQVVEELEPNHNVKDLTVEGYGGTKFPKWLASASEFLPIVVSLCLSCCPNIESLPPLGQLPSLQKLKLEGLHGIKVIGKELCGNGSLIAPFPRLSFLEISSMKKWEEWDICKEGESFPRLQQLHISGCPRLKKSLPEHLPCLKTLHIARCRNLEATLPKSSCMEELSLNNCPAMESLPQGGMLSSLRRLSIEWCSKVIESGRDWGLHELLSLKVLEIGGIEDMESFPEEGLLPPNLQSLSFWNSHNMKSINHRGLVHLHSLTSLSFGWCGSMSFEGMPKDGLPPSLSHLSIGIGCELLKERCEKEKGPDWPIIADIAHIHVD